MEFPPEEFAEILVRIHRFHFIEETNQIVGENDLIEIIPKLHLET